MTQDTSPILYLALRHRSGCPTCFDWDSRALKRLEVSLQNPSWGQMRPSRILESTCSSYPGKQATFLTTKVATIEPC